MWQVYDLLLKDDNTTKQLVFKSFHGDRKINNAAQRTNLSTQTMQKLVASNNYI